MVIHTAKMYGFKTLLCIIPSFLNALFSTLVLTKKYLIFDLLIQFL